MKTAKYFSAKWCGPCKQFKPIMQKLSNEGYDIQFIDGDENPSMANEYDVRSVPTTVIQENSVEVKRIIGIRSRAEMIEELS